MTPANCPAVTPPELPCPLVRSPCNWKLRGQLSVDGGHQQLHHQTDGQRSKPATPRHHRLHTDDGIEPHHRRYDREANGQAIPDTQAAVKCIGSRRGGYKAESILTFLGWQEVPH